MYVEAPTSTLIMKTEFHWTKLNIVSNLFYWIVIQKHKPQHPSTGWGLLFILQPLKPYILLVVNIFIKVAVYFFNDYLGHKKRA